jgi:DNA-binding transcriptional LysR family regulator
MPTPLKRFLRITPQQLRAFEATARLLSISKAAQELSVTQPTISVQLRELAEKVGHALFTQEGNRLQLTAAGEALVRVELDISRSWQRYEQYLVDMVQKHQRSLHVGAMSGAEYFLPACIRQFESAHPDVMISLTLGSGPHVVKEFNQGRIDCLITPDALHISGLESHPVIRSRLVIIACATHRLAQHPDVLTLEQLSGERWVRTEALTPAAPSSMQMESIEAAIRCVSAGMGIAEIPVEALGSDDDHSALERFGVAALQVAGYPKEREWLMAWHRDTPAGAVAARFLQYLATR